MSWRRASEAACPTVARVFAANRDHALALCLEATERGDHALAQWIADRLAEPEKILDATELCGQNENGPERCLPHHPEPEHNDEGAVAMPLNPHTAGDRPASSLNISRTVRP